MLLNGFFVAAEFAIVKLRTTRIEELRRVHGWRGRVLATIHRDVNAYLSGCQLGITLASLGLGWIGEPAFADLLRGPAAALGLADDPEALEAAAFVFAFTLISFLHIVVGEQAPKSLAIRKAEAVSLWTAIPLWLFYWSMYPFIWVLNASSGVILRMMGVESGDAYEVPYSREELRTILHLSRPAQEGPEHTISAVASHALELPDLQVSEVMRPMRELVTLRNGSSVDEVRRLIAKHRYSRYPVQNEQGDVLGVLHIKDIYLEESGPFYFTRLQRWLHQPVRAAEDTPVQDLLRSFQAGTSHFALVLDRDDRPCGFLTIEDVLETIFGEITDEHEPLRKEQVRREPVWDDEGNLIARGDTPLFRIERALGRAIQGSEEVTTLSGLLMRKLDRVPQPGDRFEHDQLEFEVLKARGPRIDQVRMRNLFGPPPEESDPPAT